MVEGGTAVQYTGVTTSLPLLRSRKSRCCRKRGSNGAHFSGLISTSTVHTVVCGVAGVKLVVFSCFRLVVETAMHVCTVGYGVWLLAHAPLCGTCIQAHGSSLFIMRQAVVALHRVGDLPFCLFALPSSCLVFSFLT